MNRAHSAPLRTVLVALTVIGCGVSAGPLGEALSNGHLRLDGSDAGYVDAGDVDAAGPDSGSDAETDAGDAGCVTEGASCIATDGTKGVCQAGSCVSCTWEVCAPGACAGNDYSANPAACNGSCATNETVSNATTGDGGLFSYSCTGGDSPGTGGFPSIDDVLTCYVDGPDFWEVANYTRIPVLYAASDVDCVAGDDPFSDPGSVYFAPVPFPKPDPGFKVYQSLPTPPAGATLITFKAPAGSTIEIPFTPTGSMKEVVARATVQTGKTAVYLVLPKAPLSSGIFWNATNTNYKQIEGAGDWTGLFRPKVVVGSTSNKIGPFHATKGAEGVFRLTIKTTNGSDAWKE